MTRKPTAVKSSLPSIGRYPFCDMKWMCFILIFSLSTSSFMMHGCASIIKGSTQDVTIVASSMELKSLTAEGCQTIPPKQCEIIYKNRNYHSPATLSVDRDRPFLVYVECPLHKDVAHVIAPNATNPLGWFFLSFFFGLVFGSFIDLSTGAGYFEYPSTISLTPGVSLPLPVCP